MPPKSHKRKVPGPISAKDVQIKLNTLKANGPPTQPEPARKLTVLPSDPAPNHEMDSVNRSGYMNNSGSNQNRIATENRGPRMEPEPARKLASLPSDTAPNHEMDSDNRSGYMNNSGSIQNRIATENVGPTLPRCDLTQEQFDVNKVKIKK